MQFVFAHNNINVMDLEKSVRFYEDALNLKVVKTRESDDGSFKLTFLQGEGAPHQLELTWLRDRTEPYNLGDNEFHMAFHADDMETSYARHKEMGCIVYENKSMGIYFIADPDGYWTEIVPAKD